LLITKKSAFTPGETRLLQADDFAMPPQSSLQLPANHLRCSSSIPEILMPVNLKSISALLKTATDCALDKQFKDVYGNSATNFMARLLG